MAGSPSPVVGGVGVGADLVARGLVRLGSEVAEHNREYERGDQDPEEDSEPHLELAFPLHHPCARTVAPRFDRRNQDRDENGDEEKG